MEFEADFFNTISQKRSLSFFANQGQYLVTGRVEKIIRSGLGGYLETPGILILGLCSNDAIRYVVIALKERVLVVS